MPEVLDDHATFISSIAVKTKNHAPLVIKPLAPISAYDALAYQNDFANVGIKLTHHARSLRFNALSDDYDVPVIVESLVINTVQKTYLNFCRPNMPTGFYSTVFRDTSYGYNYGEIQETAFVLNNFALSRYVLHGETMTGKIIKVKSARNSALIDTIIQYSPSAVLEYIRGAGQAGISGGTMAAETSAINASINFNTYSYPEGYLVTNNAASVSFAGVGINLGGDTNTPNIFSDIKIKATRKTIPLSVGDQVAIECYQDSKILVNPVEVTEPSSLVYYDYELDISGFNTDTSQIIAYISDVLCMGTGFDIQSDNRLIAPSERPKPVMHTPFYVPEKPDMPRVVQDYTPTVLPAFYYRYYLADIKFNVLVGGSVSTLNYKVPLRTSVSGADTRIIGLAVPKVMANRDIKGEDVDVRFDIFGDYLSLEFSPWLVPIHARNNGLWYDERTPVPKNAWDSVCREYLKQDSRIFY